MELRPEAWNLRLWHSTNGVLGVFLNYLSPAYRKAFLSLSSEFVRYANSASVNAKDAGEFLNWIESVKRLSVGPDTWRLYRNAVTSTMTANPEKWPDEKLQDRIQKLKKLKGLSKRDAAAITNRPRGGMKAKSLTKKQLSELTEQLKSPRYSYGLLTLLWFKTCLITGLRPNEWHEAEIITTKGIDALDVKNSKVVQYDVPGIGDLDLGPVGAGRGMFMHRTIPLTQFTETERSTIRQWVVTLKNITRELQDASGGDLETIRRQVYEKARKTLYAATQKVEGLGSKNITLYTARHIFRTRNKTALLASGMSESEVDLWLAILMGHGSSKSNYSYGLESDVGISQEGAIDISCLGDEKAALARNILTRYS